MTKDYTKKPYTSNKPYFDFMKTVPARSIWNQITEESPGFSEYSATGVFRFTPRELAMLRYLKQSEMKKPYDGMDYEEMEYVYEGLPGLWPLWDLPNFDHPWMVSSTIPPTIDELEEAHDPGIWILHVIVDGGYCPGDTVNVTLFGSHPIFAINIKYPNFIEAGTSIIVLEGLGTNEVLLEITADEDESGQIDFEAYLQAFDAPLIGTAGKGWTDADIPQARESECCSVDCADFLPDYPASANTVVQSSSASVSVLPGNGGDYTWAIGIGDGADMTLQFATTAGVSNNVIAGASACGTARITVQDKCGCETTFFIRCTTGSWNLDGTGPAFCNDPNGGCQGPVFCNGDSGSGGARGVGWASLSGLPNKNCFPGNCKWYYEEILRRTRADSFTNASSSVCETSRSAFDCTGTDCTFWGTGTGMQCGECIGHPNVIPPQCAPGAGTPQNMDSEWQKNPALYLPATCILNGGVYTYCRYCYQSIILRRYRWTC